MRKSKKKTLVAFALAIVGSAVIRDYKLGQNEDVSKQVAEEAFEETFKGVNTSSHTLIEESETPLAATIPVSEAETVTQTIVPKNAAQVKPNPVYKQKLKADAEEKGLPMDLLAEGLDGMLDLAEAKLEVKEDLLLYGIEAHHEKEIAKAELRLLAFDSVLDRSKEIGKRFDKVEKAVDDFHERQEKIDAAVSRAEERHDKIIKDVDSAVSSVENTHGKIKEDVDKITSHLEEKHERVMDNVGAVVSHVKEKHEKREERHEKVKGFVGKVLHPKKKS